MPEIKISQSTHDRLVARIAAFEESPEDVIRRLLDETEGLAGKKAHRAEAVGLTAPAPPGSILPVSEYWLPILRIIADAGGAAPANDVIDALESQLAPRLADRDQETLRNGEVRWRNRARFARLRMKERGFLSDSSHRGVWEITDQGLEYLREAEA